ncbi:hypothetical protein BKA56DRAFT_624781 [Ilyonectria sp. MPI-CAGE-AT-0026]|nr:hypothetical protein BKA56DRAFT_624781 [Ilyonectria sp. MPI-CAGE-AT-0026]
MRNNPWCWHKFHNSYRTRLIGGIDEAHARREQFDILARKKAFLSNIARGKHINTDAPLEAPEPLPVSHPLAKRRMSHHTCQLTDPELWRDRGTDDGLRGAPLFNQVSRYLLKS